jgi:hypothetical protein
MVGDSSQNLEAENGRKSSAKRSSEHSFDAAKLELESRRLDGDLGIRKAELDDKRAQRAFEERRLQDDAELKRLELSQAAGYGLKFTAAQATVAAAVLALISGTVGAVIQSLMTRDVEASKSKALISIEEIKAKASIDLERQKQDAAERLDRLKFETSLIAKATESPSREEQIRNLKFYLSAGFLKDDGGKISRMDVREFPSSTTPTVLGGVSSSMADWPWLVSVFRAGRFFCNGTLIAPRMVLLAANCVDRGQSANYEVATATDDGKYLKIVRRIPVTKIILHPAYAEDSLKNDIAILELGLELPPPYATISAQRSADPKAGTLALVGTIDFQSKPGNLLQSSVPIYDDATCAAKSSREGIICAGSEHGGAGACPGSGSAGGQLVVFGGAGRKYQIGIVSTADCDVPETAYGVYTRISSYANWIKQVVPNVLSEPVTEGRR